MFVSLMIIINWKSCVVSCYGSLPSLWGQNRLHQKWEHKSAGLTRRIRQRTRRKNRIINGKSRKQAMLPWENTAELNQTHSSRTKQDNGERGGRGGGAHRAVQKSATLGVTWNCVFSQQLCISHGSQIAHYPESYSREDNLSSVQAHRLSSEMRPFYSFSYSSVGLFLGW